MKKHYYWPDLINSCVYLIFWNDPILQVNWNVKETHIFTMIHTINAKLNLFIANSIYIDTRLIYVNKSNMEFKITFTYSINDNRVQNETIFIGHLSQWQLS